MISSFGSVLLSREQMKGVKGGLLDVDSEGGDSAKKKCSCGYMFDTATTFNNYENLGYAYADFCIDCHCECTRKYPKSNMNGGVFSKLCQA